MLLEEGNDGLRENDADGGHGTDKHKTENRGEHQSLFHPVNPPGLVIEGSNRLEALTHAKTDAHEEAGILGDHAHGGDGCVTEGLGQIVQQAVGHRSQTLADQRGETHPADRQIQPPVPAHSLKADGALGHFQIHEQQDQKADDLGNRRGQACAVNAETELRNQEIIAENVQNTAGSQTEHGIEGLAFVAKTVIEDKGADDEGGRQKDPGAVIHSVGQDGLRTAKEAHQGLEEGQTQHRDQKAQNSARKEAG